MSDTLVAQLLAENNDILHDVAWMEVDRVSNSVRPFMVQAYDRRQRQGWITDSRHAEAPLAVQAAKRLAKQWSRTVRVVDEDERVVFQLGTTQRARRKGRDDR